MRKILVLCLLAVTLVGCSGNNENSTPRRMHEPKRAMYHWKNTFSMSEEYDFIKEHNIGRLYIRFFDVTWEPNSDGSGMQAIPTATIRFEKYCWSGINKYNIPEIVPTVFITPDAIDDIYRKDQIRSTARKLVERIDNICSFYDVPKDKVKEIQLDCDWTAWSERPFFELCKEVRNQMPKNMLLSSTIRLHQLRQEAPPVDYGVLMLYNTNNLRDPSVKNSILSADDVKPYLKRVKYNLPLDFAYPVFSWDLWFHDGKFRSIVRSESKADSLRHSGEMIRHEEVDYREILKVKELVESKTQQPKRSTILYHLDKNTLNRYSSDEIETIFGR